MKNRILLMALIGCTYIHATISDNRFLPWYTQTVTNDYRLGSFSSQLFFITADSAYANPIVKSDSARNRNNSDVGGIPEVYGIFDQLQLGLAAEAVGVDNPLNPVWKIGDKIEWNVHGKLQGQGCALSYHHHITKHLSVGMNINFLHLASNQKFILPTTTISNMGGLSSAQQLDLDAQRRQLLQNLGLSDNHWSTNGFSDMCVKLRLGNSTEYNYKCRYISAGLSAGVIIPTSKQRDLEYASSIPLGGERLTGFVIGGDVHAELKEDWWAGLSLELSKRFSQDQLRRLPVKGEPEIFGATTGLVKVDSGFTVAFSPFVRFDNLRDGLHFQMQYIYQSHSHDVWTDKRADKTIPVNFANVVKMSSWDSEYILFKLSYDGYTADRSLPTLTFSWDIPLKILKPAESVKAQKVSLGFEYSF